MTSQADKLKEAMRRQQIFRDRVKLEKKRLQKEKEEAKKKPQA